ncbi:PadR family transcriptional regulator [Actinomadura rupiterrae]|uniref:PadR family transcriptional regulator n=1 Tax=Actinomadura rupiterrae TaxID=559627 RepID=UPI0020A60171|nr:PadR family transcriptional regulator [Actinomadura rupiterrae]MCP2335991.1 DNA-binding PadR family transcriptional regulator [Actinomadura rupiterrae]
MGWGHGFRGHGGPGGPGGWPFGGDPRSWEDFSRWGGPGPFGPGGPPWKRGRFGGPGGRARKGDVRAAILALLAEQPRNGYQVIQEIAERSGGAWRPSPGAVYPALQQLADEGLVASEEDGGRRVFHLTDEGRAYAGEHADELAEPWARMAPEFGEGVPELFKAVAGTGAAAMEVLRSGGPDGVGRAVEILTTARRDLYRILAEDAPGAPSTPEE